MTLDIAELSLIDCMVETTSDTASEPRIADSEAVVTTCVAWPRWS